MPLRLVAVVADIGALAGVFQKSAPGDAFYVSEGLPNSSICIEAFVHPDVKETLCFIIEDDSFEEVPSGAPIPWFAPVVVRIGIPTVVGPREEPRKETREVVEP